MPEKRGHFTFAVLKTPAWRVERYYEGALIELVPGLFDNDNPEHLRVQEEVMDYFDLL